MPAVAAQESSIAVEAAAEPESQVVAVQPEAFTPEPQPSLSEADFEARVAAAMAAYGQAAESRDTVIHQPVVQEATDFSPASVEEYHPVSAVNAETDGMQSMAAEAPTDSESQPAPEMESIAQEIEASSVPIVASAVAEIPAEPDTVAHTAAAGVSHNSVMAGVEAELPSTLEAATQEIQAATQSTNTSGHEHDNIAQAVHRVMERMKENLVEEIVRELKSKK